MVDRVALIKAIEPRLKLVGSQGEALRTALDKAVAEAVMALPLASAIEMPELTRGDLEVVLSTLEQKQAEKLATIWEPKRKLDADLKSSIKKDLVDLLIGRRGVYEPITASLEEARQSNAAKWRAVIEKSAPAKDLKALLTKWDKNLNPKPTSRTGLVQRLLALLDGASPAAKPANKSGKK